MTKFDLQLARSFCAARWHESDGRPVCPKCFDGDDVQEDPASRRQRTPELGTYVCRCCITKFTDRSGTPLAKFQQPLRAWALALLTVSGHPTEWTPSGFRLLDLGVPNRILRRLRAVWKTAAPLAARWREELSRAGMTVDRLIQKGRRTA